MKVTREEQRKLRELKKALPKMLQNKIKQYKFKKTDYAIWFMKDNLFFTFLPHIGVPDDGKCYCWASENIKPLWLDDLFWEIFQMESNKSAPLSLRATGAFAVRGSELFEGKTELAKWSIDELDHHIDECLEHFYTSVQRCTIDDFYNNLNMPGYHSELRNALSLIYRQQYQQVLDCVDDRESGGFINVDLSINEAMIEYCRRKLSI